MTISFGIEFEFNHLDEEERYGYHLAPRSHAHTGSWDIQYDGTAGSELVSPVWTSLEQAINDIREEFEYWIERNDGIIPYPYNYGDTSLGQHIHIGLPNRRLTTDEKRHIAKAIAHIYPFLASIHAQPIPSRRGLYSRYCYSVSHRLNTIPLDDHYAEISDSIHGTVEFRLFDANIPQASLAIIFIMQKIAENNINNNVNVSGLREIYRSDRTKGLTYGVKALNVIHYLTKAKELGNIEQIPNIPCVKEILYLVAKYGMNPYDVLQYSQASHYEYFKNQYLNPSEFLGNVLQISNIQHRDKLEEIKQEAGRINSIDQLIDIATQVVQALIRQTLQQITLLSRQDLKRSEVIQAIQNRQYVICRINELEGYTREQVAERISYLLRNHGEGYVTPMRPEDIISCSERFYVFAVKNPRTNRYEILGNIAIHMRNGEICHIVVDRRYRQLGISKLLLQHVLNLRERPFYAYVRRNNIASLNLFKSFGFRIVEKGERSYKLELR